MPNQPIHPRRALTLGLTAAVAALAAIVAIAASSTQQSRAGDHSARAMTVVVTPKALAFHDAMRELWEYHGTYTERAIVDYVAGNPDIGAVLATLYQNQTDIGNAVKPFYGTAAGDQLTVLLKTHIHDAVATLVAAKAGNQPALKQALAAFYANGNRIARFLHAANPRNWPLAAMETMMRIHLNQVVGLAVDQIKGRYAAAVELYKTYIDHLNVGMADMLSNGIIRQFPGRFD